MVEANPTISIEEEQKYVLEEEKEEEKLAITTGTKKKKSGKVTNGKKFVICVKESSSSASLVRKLIEQAAPAWTEVIQVSKAQMYWVCGGYRKEEVLEYLNQAPGNKMMNRYPGTADLIYKDV